MDFTPKGHPKGADLTQTEKMSYLQLEKTYHEVSRELSTYPYNEFMAEAQEKLYESRELALKSLGKPGLVSPGVPKQKDEPLRADGFPNVSAKPKSVVKPLEVKKHEEINVRQSKKVSGKKRGRPAKDTATNEA